MKCCYYLKPLFRAITRLLRFAGVEKQFHAQTGVLPVVEHPPGVEHLVVDLRIILGVAFVDIPQQGVVAIHYPGQGALWKTGPRKVNSY